jgi:hypothetical protein
MGNSPGTGINSSVIEDASRRWRSKREFPADGFDRISYEESKVFVNVTKKAIREAPQYHVTPLGEAYGDTRNFD